MIHLQKNRDCCVVRACGAAASVDMTDLTGGATQDARMERARRRTAGREGRMLVR